MNKYPKRKKKIKTLLRKYQEMYAKIISIPMFLCIGIFRNASITYNLTFKVFNVQHGPLYKKQLFYCFGKIMVFTNFTTSQMPTVPQASKCCGDYLTWKLCFPYLLQTTIHVNSPASGNSSCSSHS